MTYAELAELTRSVRLRSGRARRRSGRPGLRAVEPDARALRGRARHAEARRRRLPTVLGVRLRADPPADGPRRRPRAGHLGLAVSPQGRARPRRAAPSAARAARRRRRRRPGHDRRWPRPAAAAGVGVARLQHRPDLARRHGAAPLHVGHDRHAEGRGARARGRAGPPRHRLLRPGPAPRGRVLVHGRPRMGDRHVLRHHLSADPRPDEPDRRRTTSTPSAGTGRSSRSG